MGLYIPKNYVSILRYSQFRTPEHAVTNQNSSSGVERLTGYQNHFDGFCNRYYFGGRMFLTTSRMDYLFWISDFQDVSAIAGGYNVVNWKAWIKSIFASGWDVLYWTSIFLSDKNMFRLSTTPLSTIGDTKKVYKQDRFECI